MRCAKDIKISPHHTALVPVNAFFVDDEDIVIEKNVIFAGGKVAFVVPNAMINPRSPFIPVHNPTDRPQTLRRGEFLTSYDSCKTSLDAPPNEEVWHKYNAHACSIAAVIRTQMDEDVKKKEASHSTSSTHEEEEDEELGPKTSYMPDVEIYDSAKLREILDVADDLPPEMEERVWTMLEKNQLAFAFDGRLGHYPSKVKIKLKNGDNEDPISLPMYSSSPAKREVIDKQIDSWYELGVIEPSESPWAAPVVIAYRNQKPRFCIDYRKLNAEQFQMIFPYRVNQTSFKHSAAPPYSRLLTLSLDSHSWNSTNWTNQKLRSDHIADCGNFDVYHLGFEMDHQFSSGSCREF